MTSRYGQLLFTPQAQRHQEKHGSRRSYANMTAGPAEADRLTEDEAAFAASRTSFYLASVSSTGWPYLQHRGGPPGFLRAVDERTLAFADYRGNKQYITTGNLDHENRVALFLMDYPARARLKILGRARTAGPEEWPDTAGPLLPGDYRAVVERVVLIEVEAFDWNCPQHIEPRYTVAEVEDAIAPLRKRMAELEAENERLKAERAQPAGGRA
ncbi:pyridoxamine 5'-phosphate oxidase family protein [Streptomyces sp. MUM 203J]|uniref:pyridoxamine 5'-phosphate oxidase family protein n=1 Tax=Streptomyces sp. MUM 203J TaxID=2791990 RepID=UPI001F03601B|nr:pyridoxamine 5'-phosphate oxidase family protein [Streptomyces sp. MUM 203J]MCH0541213.1 pyridoxamine 5'-phosphate oxidase family protein [Streptomyces sp. MUM 203J]